jgi:hypothetical protein
MDLGDERCWTGEDWAVPAGALTHALRTPLNVLKGYGSLLASGELGRLAPQAAEAAGEMRRAVSELEAAVELLAPLALPPAAAADRFELRPLLDGAFARVGYAPSEDGDLDVEAVDWPGWRELVAAIVRLCAADGADRVEVGGGPGVLELRASFPRSGAGDGHLAGCVARARAAAGGFRLDLPAGGGVRLEAAPGLISARGGTIYQGEVGAG